MNGIILTQYDGKILGPIAKVLGMIMKGIFNFLDLIGIPNIGLSIILFTIVIYLLLMPLTIKQQKFSKLSAKMNPEIQAIQEKYKNRKDTDSQMAMQQETQAVYAKYGVSPTGSCVQLLIQMPILFALYRVIYAIPAYVTKIGDTFRVLASQIIEKGGVEWLKNSGSDTISNVVMMYGKKLTNGTTPLEIENGVIDVLNKLSSSDMALVASKYDLNGLTYPVGVSDAPLILGNGGLLDTYNNFLGLNMGETPNNMIRQAISTGQWLIVIGAIAIPVLSAVTQWINVKLMPQQQNDNMSEKAAQMQKSMKTMNMVMPVMSAWFCFTLPAGMGLYWVAGSVVRSIQQIIINKHIDKMDFDEIIKKNSSKSAKKMEKLKRQQERMNEIAAINTRNIQQKGNTSSKMTEEEREKKLQKANEYYNGGNAKPGSMMAKANMVKKYNERNNKDHS